LKNASRYHQIKISVIGRNSGQTISISVWFVLEGETLYLVASAGSDTQWYKNVLHNHRFSSMGAECRANAVTDAKGMMSVVEKFREKYGAKDVRRYYSKFDVAVRIEPI
jgi:hypothetical protein